MTNGSGWDSLRAAPLMRCCVLPAQVLQPLPRRTEEGCGCSENRALTQCHGIFLARRACLKHGKISWHGISRPFSLDCFGVVSSAHMPRVLKGMPFCHTACPKQKKTSRVREPARSQSGRIPSTTPIQRRRESRRKEPKDLALNSLRSQSETMPLRVPSQITQRQLWTLLRKWESSSSCL